MTMTAAAYNSLREASNAESLSYGELMMIQAAFDLVPDEQLSDQREYALADDMLDEIAGTIGDGREVFITDDMLIPACDLCEGPQYSEGDDWNGDTGNHRSCEVKAMTRESAIALLEEVAGGLNDGHARWPVPELGQVIDWLKSTEEVRA